MDAVAYAKQREAIQKARDLRYRRPALQSLGFEFISNGISEIWEECGSVQYSWDDENILDALDGDEEEFYEFRERFSELSGKAEMLNDALSENWCYDDFEKTFDDCTVALIGNRYNVLGYDTYEEDYFGLTAFESKLAMTDSGKRLMNLTKKEMISTIGQCFGILLAYYDLRQQYDCLKSAMDIIRGRNTALIGAVKEIETAYEKICDGSCSYEDYSKFDLLVSQLPQKCWIE